MALKIIVAIVVVIFFLVASSGLIRDIVKLVKQRKAKKTDDTKNDSNSDVKSD